MIRFIAAIDTHPRLGKWSAWMASLPLVGRIWSKLLENPKELERFLKFAIVGTIGAVVDFVVLNIMKLIFEGMGLGVGWNLSMEAHQIQLVAANVNAMDSGVFLFAIQIGYPIQY